MTKLSSAGQHGAGGRSLQFTAMDAAVASSRSEQNGFHRSQGVHQVHSPRRPRPLPLRPRPVGPRRHGKHLVGGELGFVDQPVASTLTREQVRQDFVAFRRNPILNDGATLFVGGEQGYVDQPASRTTREAARQDLLDRHAALAVPVAAP